jgi:ABC-2 type transport system permease protein
MRLLAEEQHDGTIVLLFTAPIRDWQIVLGKWLAGVAVVLIFIALTAYMPIMIMMNGSVHLGHIAAGYLGLVLTGFAAVAIGLLTSALTQHQVLAAVTGAAIGIGFTFLNWIAKKVDAPFDEVFSYLSMYDTHFLASFSKGAIHTRDIVFFLSITFFFLLATRQVLGARRWR